MSDPSPPPALEYQTPQPRPPRPEWQIGQCIAGALLTVSGVPAALILAMAGARGSPSVLPSSLRPMMFLGALALTLAASLALAIWLLMHRRFRGWGVGIFLGYGLILLLVGGCFAVVVGA